MDLFLKWAEIEVFVRLSIQSKDAYACMYENAGKNGKTVFPKKSSLDTSDRSNQKCFYWHGNFLSIFFNLPKVSVVWTPIHQVFPSLKMKYGSYFDDSRNNLQFTTDISKVAGRTYFIIVTPEAFSNQSG